jgi:hypothetical protein
MVKFRVTHVFLWFAMIAFLVSACGPSPETPSSRTEYLPHWGNRAENFAKWPEGSLGHDFYRACSSKDLQTAARQWQAFLDKYAPEDAAFQDAFHWNHVIYAKQELMRVYYLLGKSDDADRILREFDPVKGSFQFAVPRPSIAKE